MASEKLDFAEFLAILEAKRAALDALIGTYKAAMSLGALGQPGEIDISIPAGTLTLMGTSPSMSKGGAVELPRGALLGMSIPTAIKLYLSAARGKQTTREIMNGIKEGGVESTSKFFENTVATALHRLKGAGEVLRFADGWALAEFYPEHLRNRLATHADQKAAKKSAPAAKTRKRKAKKQARVLNLPAGQVQEAAG